MKPYINKKVWYLNAIRGILNRNQTGKRIPTRALCQKNQGTVKTK
jgi:hypothetical protein